MKSILSCMTVLLAQLIFLQGVIADDAANEQSALEFQSARFQAMVDADVASLEGFLADELTYAHTTGWTESKTEFLATVGSGRLDYISLTPRDVRVQMYGDIAVMTGLARMRGVLGDKPVELTIRFLDVSRRTGDSWQLVAWQSVRIPEGEN